MFAKLEKEIDVLPAAILEAMLHQKFFDYQNLMKRKKAIERFLRMNGGANDQAK